MPWKGQTIPEGMGAEMEDKTVFEEKKNTFADLLGANVVNSNAWKTFQMWAAEAFKIGEPATVERLRRIYSYTSDPLGYAKSLTFIGRMQPSFQSKCDWINAFTDSLRMGESNRIHCPIRDDGRVHDPAAVLALFQLAYDVSYEWDKETHERRIFTSMPQILTEICNYQRSFPRDKEDFYLNCLSNAYHEALDMAIREYVKQMRSLDAGGMVLRQIIDSGVLWHESTMSGIMPLGAHIARRLKFELYNNLGEVDKINVLKMVYPAG